jgi:hypothetical protein
MHTGVLTFLVTPGKTEEAVLIYLGSVVPKCGSNGGSGAGSCRRIPR